MSRFPQLAIVLSLTACESLVPPEPTTPKAVVKPEPVYEEVRFMTRAGPKWVKRPKPENEEPRVRVVQEPK
jgi:hypothetical protein